MKNKKRSLDKYMNGSTAVQPNTQMYGQLANMLPTLINGIISIFNKPNDPNNEQMIDKESITSPYAMGTSGLGGTRDVEVEDDEFAKTPNGTQVQFNGATHEGGGIDVNLPVGTKIFSDRIKFQGQKLSDRAKRRAAREKKIIKAIEGNETDILNKNTLNRTLLTNQIEENNDLLVQELHNKQKPLTNFKKGGIVKYPDGTDRFGLQHAGLYNLDEMNQALLDNDAYPLAYNRQPQPLVSSFTKSKPNITATTIPTNNIRPSVNPITNDVETTTDNSTNNVMGNVIGSAGLAINSLAPLLTTLRNQKNSKPNINAFTGFGRQAMDINDSALRALDFEETEADIDNAISRNTQTQNAINNTSSLNTQNALRTIIDYGADRNQLANNAKFANVKSGILDNRAKTSMVIDERVMSGNQEADLNNRKDMDNFYNNVNKDLGNLGTSIQEFGKNMNQEQYNEDYMTLLGDLSKYGISYKRNSKGKLVQVIK